MQKCISAFYQNTIFICLSYKCLWHIQGSHDPNQNAYIDRMQAWDVFTFEVQSFLYGLSSCDQSWMDGWMQFEKNDKLHFPTMQSSIIKYLLLCKIAVSASKS